MKQILHIRTIVLFLLAETHLVHFNFILLKRNLKFKSKYCNLRFIVHPILNLNHRVHV